MKRTWVQVKNYLLKPENGAGLLYVALAFGVLRLWLLEAYEYTRRGETAGGAVTGMMRGDQGLFFLWTLLSFALCVWLAFLLLRKRLSPRALKRVLLVALVHALGALRFYDWGMLLLSILPLFAIAPLVLLPDRITRE